MRSFLTSIRCCFVYLRNPKIMEIDKPYWNLEHVGFGYLYAALSSNGHEVIIINGANENLDNRDVLERILSFEPSLCGFSPTCMTIRDAIKISRELKNKHQSIHICFGGHHASHSAQEILSNEYSIDSVVHGYAETTIVDLVSSLCNADILHSIKGISYRNSNGDVIESPFAKTCNNLDTMPTPIHSNNAYDAKSFGLYTTRGCSNSCSFCSTPEFGRFQGLNSLQMRSATNVVSEIEHLCNVCGRENIIEISFLDDNFVTYHPQSKSRISDIAQGIINKHLKVRCWFMCRADTFDLKDINLLNQLREAGFVKILLGVESGDNNTLKIYKKDSSVYLNNAAIDLLTEFGFILHLTMILFHPFSRMAEIKKNAAYIHGLLQRPNVSFLSSYCSRLLALPGSSMHKRLCHSDMMLSSDLIYIDPFAYRFVEPAVQSLALHMQNLEAEIAPVTWLITDIRNFIGVRDIKKISKYEFQIQCIEQKVSAINDFIHDYFTMAITIAEKSEIPTINHNTKYFVNQLRMKKNDLSQNFFDLENRIDTEGFEKQKISLQNEISWQCRKN